MGVEPDEFPDRDPIALDDRSAPATGVAHTLHRDYETRSNTNLPKVGVDKYAADPSTEVLCAAYAVDDGPVQVWLIPSERIHFGKRLMGVDRSAGANRSRAAPRARAQTPNKNGRRAFEGGRPETCIEKTLTFFSIQPPPPLAKCTGPNAWGCTMSATTTRDAKADAALALLCERWPKCCFMFQGLRQPLKIGIHKDIPDGLIEPKILRLAFRLYVNNPGYLNAMRLGAARVDVNGEISRRLPLPTEP